MPIGLSLQPTCHQTLRPIPLRPEAIDIVLDGRSDLRAGVQAVTGQDKVFL